MRIGERRENREKKEVKEEKEEREKKAKKQSRIQRQYKRISLFKAGCLSASSLRKYEMNPATPESENLGNLNSTISSFFKIVLSIRRPNRIKRGIHFLNFLENIMERTNPMRSLLGDSVKTIK